MRLIVAGALLLLLTACDRAAQQPPMALTQQQRLCAVVDEFRSSYRAVSEKPKYLDQDRDLKDVYARRNASMQALLGDGSIQEWTGKVEDLFASDRGAYLKVDLGCKALLVPTDAQVVPRDSAVFEQLRALHKGGSVTVSGHLVRGDANNARFVRGGFLEGSLTDEGSMRKPELVFVVTSARP